MGSIDSTSGEPPRNTELLYCTYIFINFYSHLFYTVIAKSVLHCGIRLKAHSSCDATNWYMPYPNKGST